MKTQTIRKNRAVKSRARVRSRRKKTRIESNKQRVNKRSQKKTRVRSKKRKSIRKQRGGMLPAIGVGLGLSAAASLAYAGFRLVSQVNDHSVTLSLLDTPMIDYLPKIKVIETKSLMESYLNSLTTMELFTLLLDRQDLFRSQSILNLLKDVSIHQTDIKGDNRIKKLESLIDTLKRQNEDVMLQRQADELKSDTYDSLKEDSSQEKISPVEVVSDMSQDTSVDKPPEMPPDMPRDTSEDKPPEMPQDTSVNKPPEMSQDVSVNKPPEMPQDVSLNKPPEMSQDVSLNKPPEMPQDVSVNKPPEMPPNMSQDVPGDKPPEMPQDMPVDKPPEMPMNRPESSTGAAMIPPEQQGMGYFDQELGEEFQRSDLVRKMTVNPDIMFSENTLIKTLERHLLATARFPGESYPKQETVQKEGRVVSVTPFVTVRGVQWYEEVVVKGVYDEDFSNSVDTLLEERGSLKLMNTDMKNKIDRQLKQLQDNELFKSCILRKMRECCSKPRGYMDYIQGNISWDSTKRCLSCPQQDCLIYIHNFYYHFLLEMTPGISLIDKLYCLIMAEARMAILSRCICLESIRIQDGKTDKVEYLLDQIYNEDAKKNRLLPEPSEKYTTMFDRVKKGQVGGINKKPDVQDKTETALPQDKGPDTSPNEQPETLSNIQLDTQPEMKLNTPVTVNVSQTVDGEQSGGSAAPDYIPPAQPVQQAQPEQPPTEQNTNVLPASGMPQINITQTSSESQNTTESQNAPQPSSNVQSIPSSTAEKESESYKLGIREASASIAQKQAQNEIREAENIVKKETDMLHAEKQKEAEQAKQLQEAQAMQQQELGREQVAEQKMEEAQKKELEDSQMLQSETQIADKAVTGLESLQKDYDTLKSENEDMKSRLQKTSEERDKVVEQLTQFESTTPAGMLRKELSSQLEAQLEDEDAFLETVVTLIKMKQPEKLTPDSLQDKSKVVDAFMDVYFPTIQVAMKDYRSDGNPQGFLDLYNNNYALFQFIEPQRISHEVYFTDSSDGYLDELLLTVFQRMPKDTDKLAIYSRMCAPILLHSDVIDEYPLQKLSEREFVLTPILQSMIPTLRQNPDVFAKLLIAMKSHNRERDALLFGDLYLFKDAMDKHPELKDIFDSLAKQDILRQKKTTEGLDPGVDKTHCDQKIEDVYNSLKRGHPTPISSADLLLMTQCQQQSKGATDILY
tara:strand:- start:1835 stop:5404 length:3570 start_codon:yes stop_codon:yes gene_type:complete